MYTKDMSVYFKMVDKIKKQNIDDTLLHCMFCVEGIVNNIEEQTIFEMAQLTENIWLKSDIDLSISRIADVIVENWETIKEDNMSIRDILTEYCDTLSNH